VGLIFIVPINITSWFACSYWWCGGICNGEQISIERVQSSVYQTKTRTYPL